MTLTKYPGRQILTQVGYFSVNNNNIKKLPFTLTGHDKRRFAILDLCVVDPFFQLLYLSVRRRPFSVCVCGPNFWIILHFLITDNSIDITNEVNYFEILLS